MSKILLTGNLGFIGSHVQDTLIGLGHEVVGLDNVSSGKRSYLNPKTYLIEDDIRKDYLEEVVPKNITHIIHLAAIPRVPYSVMNPQETHDVNINGTLNILMLAKKLNVNKVVFASSSSVYGEQKIPLNETMNPKPISPYAFHKLAGEHYMRLFDELYGIPTISLRFFNVYGPRCDPDSEYSLVIGKFLKQKSEGKPLTIFGDGEQTRDFTFVSDIVSGIIKALESDVHNEVINLCNNSNVSINKIADLIGGKKQYLQPRQGDVMHTLGDNKKAKKMLGWNPNIKIEDGIKIMEDYK